MLNGHQSEILCLYHITLRLHMLKFECIRCSGAARVDAWTSRLQTKRYKRGYGLRSHSKSKFKALSFLDIKSKCVVELYTYRCLVVTSKQLKTTHWIVYLSEGRRGVEAAFGCSNSGSSVSTSGATTPGPVSASLPTVDSMSLHKLPEPFRVVYVASGAATKVMSPFLGLFLPDFLSFFLL